MRLFRARPELFKHYPRLRKAWSGTLVGLGTTTGPFGAATVVQNESGEQMAIQNRYLVQSKRNPSSLDRASASLGFVKLVKANLRRRGHDRYSIDVAVRRDRRLIKRMMRDGHSPDSVASVLASKPPLSTDALSSQKNPRLPRSKFTSAYGYYRELVNQLDDWLFYHVEKPGPLLMRFFKAMDVLGPLGDLRPWNDREYLIVDFDLLPAMIMGFKWPMAGFEAPSSREFTQLVNQLTTQIVPFLSEDPEDWWLNYQLPLLQDKGVLSASQVASARRAWGKMIAEMDYNFFQD